jgi:hypothetical protein
MALKELKVREVIVLFGHLGAVGARPESAVEIVPDVRFVTIFLTYLSQVRAVLGRTPHSSLA